MVEPEEQVAPTLFIEVVPVKFADGGEDIQVRGNVTIVNQALMMLERATEQTLLDWERNKEAYRLEIPEEEGDVLRVDLQLLGEGQAHIKISGIRDPLAKLKRINAGCIKLLVTMDQQQIQRALVGELAKQHQPPPEVDPTRQ